MRGRRAGLQHKWLQVYWPDDNRWWPGQVADINVRERRVVLLYETSTQLLPTYSFTAVCAFNE